MKNRHRIHMVKKTRKRRRFKTRRYTLYYILFTIIIITTFLILSFTVFFNIEEIEIIGNTKHKKDDILNACGIKEGDNLILTNTKNSETAIYNLFKDIDCVSVSKSFPETITIDCCDCEALFYIKKNDNDYFLVSKNNRIFKENNKNSEEDDEDKEEDGNEDKEEDGNEDDTEKNEETPSNEESDKIALKEDTEQCNEENEELKGIYLLSVEDEDFSNFNVGDLFKLPEEKEKKFAIIKNNIESKKIKNITKINIGQNDITIVFDNRITFTIDEIEKTSYLLDIACEIVRDIVGPYEKGKILYIKSKRSFHFIPKKYLT